MTVRRWLAVGAALALQAAAARADIFEWRDGSGARHFTNSREGVPPEHRDAARVVVADWQRPAPVAAAPVIPAPAAESPRAAQVVSDADWRDGYAAGLRAGIDLAGSGGGGGGGGGVQINGPLAVATVRGAETGAAYPYVDPYYGLPYYPFVTTSFDRGRSRHQTLRMLLQEQFQLDRDGPFAYQRLNQIGRGPRLAPFLSRGLPYGIRQGTRVIFR